MSVRNTLTLSIMGRDYRLSVAPEEEANLRTCAAMVEQKMQEIHLPGRVFSPDSVAVLAALRIAYENLLQRQEIEEVNRAVAKMNQTASDIDNLIALCDNTLGNDNKSAQ